MAQAGQTLSLVQSMIRVYDPETCNPVHGIPAMLYLAYDLTFVLPCLQNDSRENMGARGWSSELYRHRKNYMQFKTNETTYGRLEPRFLCYKGIPHKFFFLYFSMRFYK